MWVRNTSRYPDAEVRELVEFAIEEIDMNRVCVNVKNSRHPRRGYAYRGVPSISNAPPEARRLVTIGIGGPQHFPREEGYWNSHARRNDKARSGGVWPEPMTIGCWREQLVYVTAHEAKHVDQFNSRTKLSEVACEHFAAFMLRQWRAR